MKTVIGIIIAIAAIAGIVLFAGHKKAIAPMRGQEPQQQAQTQSSGNSASQETTNPSTNSGQAPSAGSANGQVEVSVTVPQQNQTVIVAIKNFAFSPASVTIKAGSTVTWNQQDNAPHDVIADDGSFASQTLANGQSYSHTFTKPGTYTYYCSFHPMMKGTITVQ